MALTEHRSRRTRFETGLALAVGVLAVLAAAWPDWIEALGIDPDHGNGTVEWALPVGLAVLALLVGALARRDRRLDTVQAAAAGGRSR